MQQAAHTITNYHLLAAPQEPLLSVPRGMRARRGGGGERGGGSGEWTISRTMTRQKEQADLAEEREKRKRKKRGDRKGESNDSPEIPDRGKTSAIPSLPSWWCQKTIHTEGGLVPRAFRVRYAFTVTGFHQRTSKNHE